MTHEGEASVAPARFIGFGSSLTALRFLAGPAIDSSAAQARDSYSAAAVIETWASIGRLRAGHLLFSCRWRSMTGSPLDELGIVTQPIRPQSFEYAIRQGPWNRKAFIQHTESLRFGNAGDHCRRFEPVKHDFKTENQPVAGCPSLLCSTKRTTPWR